MKKIFLYFVIFILLIYTIPAIFIKPIIKTSSDSVEEFSNNDETIIKLYHVGKDTVEVLPMNEYLYGVVAAEMPASYEMEALRAQAVVARTYTLYKLKSERKHQDADICDNSNCCQAWISKENRMARWEENKKDMYWEKIENAVNSTSKKIITYDGQVINAFFHSNSGGKTELAVNVWGGDLPYLKSVETIGEDAYSAYKSEVVLTKDEFVSKMITNYSDFSIDWKDTECIKILNYTEGNRVGKIKIGNKELTGNDFRKVVGLRSANFSINVRENDIYINVIGYGHGVGLSQSGSDVLAKNGMNYEEIIKYYFKDVEISE